MPDVVLLDDARARPPELIDFGMEVQMIRLTAFALQRKLALAILIGIALGIAGATAVHAGNARVAPGYIIAELEVTDPATMRQYGAQVPETLAAFDGRYIVLGKTTALEGESPKGFVVIAFDSKERAQAWYDSPAYQAIKPLRQRSAKGRVLIAEGVAAK
jgi:uncharacterized protein (DUF1330 family)